MPVTACDKTVGSRIRLRRKELNVTCDELSRQIGVSPGTLDRFENGEERVGASLLADISRTLGAPIGYFFSELKAIGPPEGQAPPIELTAHASAVELLSAYGQFANSQLRSVVLQFVQRLARASRETSASTHQNLREPGSRSTSGRR